MSLPQQYTAEFDRLQKEIVSAMPDDMIQFCAGYFNRRLAEQNSASSSPFGGLNPFKSYSLSGSAPPSKGEIDPDDPVAKKFNGNDNSSESADQLDGLPDNLLSRVARGRRTSVSAESLTPGNFSGASELAIKDSKVHKLSPEQQARLNQAVSKTFLFARLDKDALQSVLYALQEKKAAKGTEIITEGDEGDFFYVIESGAVDYLKSGKKVASGGPGNGFGELALMYNAPRAATVVATEDCVLWALDRITFRNILLDKTTSKRAMYEEFLKEVPVLKVLDNYERSKLADALVPEEYEPGQVVVREGDAGETFYLIESGEAVVTKQGQGKVQDIGKGDYFGEVALLNESHRQATVTASTPLRVATLDKSGFQRMLGRAVDILRDRDPTHATR